MKKTDLLEEFRSYYYNNLKFTSLDYKERKPRSVYLKSKSDQT